MLTPNIFSIFAAHYATYNVMEMPKQFDNLNSKVVDDLKITLRKSSKVSIAAASFSIYAYEALKEELESFGSCSNNSNYCPIQRLTTNN